MPVVVFLVFVYKNDGQIVLGDKEHHSGSTIHPAMFLHQIAVIFVCIFPLQILGYLFPYETESCYNRELKEKKSFRFKISRVMKSVLDIIFSFRFLFLLIICGIVMEYGVLSHPFLLADNRHYMFYIWKRLLSNVHVRRMLVPLYAFMSLYVWDILVLHKGILWSLVFATALIITLLPAHLTVRHHYFTAFKASMNWNFEYISKPQFTSPSLLSFYRNLDILHVEWW